MDILGPDVDDRTLVIPPRKRSSSTNEDPPRGIKAVPRGIIEHSEHSKSPAKSSESRRASQPRPSQPSRGIKPVGKPSAQAGRNSGSRRASEGDRDDGDQATLKLPGRGGRDLTKASSDIDDYDEGLEATYKVPPRGPQGPPRGLRRGGPIAKPDGMDWDHELFY
jgi:hypothetical protein